MISIKESTVLVTGANRGIGKSIVEEFLNSGAQKIYAAVRNLDLLQSLVEKNPERLIPIRIDLNKPETITAAANIASDINILVNNAGIFDGSDLLSGDSITAMQNEMEVNVYGLMRMAQAFAPVLKANGGGALVQLNSVASIKNFLSLATYSASKAASYSITQGLREALKEQGTLVVSVHPGPIATDMGEDAGFSEIAEPADVVSKAIITALEAGEFHSFPDTMAKQIGGAYESFAKNIVEADLMEG